MLVRLAQASRRVAKIKLGRRKSYVGRRIFCVPRRIFSFPRRICSDARKICSSPRSSAILPLPSSSIAAEDCLPSSKNAGTHRWSTSLGQLFECKRSRFMLKTKINTPQRCRKKRDARKMRHASTCIGQGASSKNSLPSRLSTGMRGAFSRGRGARGYRFKPLFFTSHSAICTALRAAPFLIWSLTSQKVIPLGLAKSLRMRPT